MSQIASCQRCGAELHEGKRFCSHACYWAWLRESGVRAGEKNAAWRGGFAGYRGPSWQRQRRKALERDGRCVECGTTEKITVHHLRPFVLFPDHESANALGNLAAMCRPCHAAADNAFWRAHPDLKASARAHFPDLRELRVCEVCSVTYEGTARSLRCLACVTFTCESCGEAFVSRKRRAVRFCSTRCHGDHLKVLSPQERLRRTRARWPKDQAAA